MEARFSVFEAFAIGIQRALDNFRLFFLAGLTILAIFLGGLLSIGLIAFLASGLSVADVQRVWVSGMSSAEVQQLYANILAHALLLVAAVIVIVVACIGLSLGYIKMGLEVYDKGTSTVATLFSCFRLVLQALVASLLYFCMVSVATAFFIIPGIYVALRCVLYMYFIVDKQAGIIESLKLSYAATAGSTWQLFALSCVSALIGSLGGLFIFFMGPVNVVAWAYTYRALTVQKVA